MLDAMEKQCSSSLIASPAVTGLSMGTLGGTYLLSNQYGCCRVMVVISQDARYDWMNWKERMVRKCMLLYLDVLLGEGNAEENPAKPRALSPPMPPRGGMLLFDEGSLLDCNQI